MKLNKVKGVRIKKFHSPEVCFNIRVLTVCKSAALVLQDALLQ